MNLTGNWVAALEHLSDEELDAITPPLRLRYCPWTPSPAQDAFLRLEVLEAFYGGAAGPGKSAALLMAALQYVDVPGYAALLVRRTYNDLSLPGALMDTAHEWLGPTAARWNRETKTWHFPSGASLTFGYLQHEDDKYRYQSAEFQYVGFDELTQFTETQYTYLFSRLRKTNVEMGHAPDGTTLADVPLRMRGASNPGGNGHDWVNERLVDEDRPANPITGERPVFVPATLDENPYIDRSTYEQSLSHLASVDRARLLRGDWSATEAGDLFKPSLITLVDDWAEPVASVRYWDLAASEVSESNKDPDYTSGVKVELGVDGYMTIVDVVHDRYGPGRLEEVVKAVALKDGYHVQVWIEQEPGATGKLTVHQFARQLPGVIVKPGLPRSQGGAKRARAVPAATAFENNVLRINRYLANLTAVLRQLRLFKGDGHGHDDVVDGISGAYYALTEGGVQTQTSVSGPASQGRGVAARAANLPRNPASVAGMMHSRRGM